MSTLKTKLTEFLGIKYPIIQAGMGPFSNNNLCVATANAGVLGLLSTSSLFNKETQPLRCHRGYSWADPMI